MLFNKKSSKGLAQIFSNDELAKYLDSLEWTDARNDRHVWQWVKLRSIVKDSLIMSGIITTLPRGKLGKYIYSVVNSRIERYNPSIIPEKTVKTDTVRKIGTFDFDSQKKGIVTKID